MRDERARALPPQCERDDRPPRPTRPRTAPALRLNIHVLLDGAVPCSRCPARGVGTSNEPRRGTRTARPNLHRTRASGRHAPGRRSRCRRLTVGDNHAKCSSLHISQRSTWLPYKYEVQRSPAPRRPRTPARTRRVSRVQSDSLKSSRA